MEFPGPLLEDDPAAECELLMLQNMQFALSNVMPQAERTGLFASLTTIMKPPAAQGPTGNPSGSYTPVYTDIPSMDAAPSMARVQATEVKAVAEILSKGLRHLLLNACYLDAPAAANGQGWSNLGYRAVVDGITYEILGAENDSQLTQTRLMLQLATI
jgi:hypothetical protein